MAEYIENNLKEFEVSLKAVLERLREEFAAIRGNRPSVELLENIKVNYYDQLLTIKQMGSLSVKPPREIEIHIWDNDAVHPVMKAIEDAKTGLSVTSEGNLLRMFLPTLTDERRQELIKFAKKTAEAARIQIRSMRDEAIKKLKTAEEKKEIAEDNFFKAKEKIQRMVDETNQKIEAVLGDKVKEIEE